MMFILKKVITLTSILLLLSVSTASAFASTFAFEIAYRDTVDTTPKHNLSMTMAYKTGGGIDEYGLSNNFDYLMNSELFSLGGGVMFSRDDIQLRVQAIYWPLYILHSRLGAGVIGHIEWYKSISLTEDLLPGIYWQFVPCSWFRIDANAHKLYKFRTIFAIADEVPFLISNTAAAEATFTFTLPFNTDIFFGVSTYEKYRYPIFGATSFYLGTSFTFEKHVYFSLEAVAHYIDFFTLSANFEDAEFKLTTRIIF